MLSNQYAGSGQYVASDPDLILDFKPRPSRQLARFLIVVHVLAVITVFLWVPDRIAVACLLALVGVSFFRNYRRHVLHRGQRTARRLVCQADGAWMLQDAQGEMLPARLLPSSYLHPRLVILNFIVEQRPSRRNLVLCPDSLDAQTLRRLRARLRVTSQGRLDASYRQA